LVLEKLINKPSKKSPYGDFFDYNSAISSSLPSFFIVLSKSLYLNFSTHPSSSAIALDDGYVILLIYVYKK
jgi:hypothetical protein